MLSICWWGVGVARRPSGPARPGRGRGGRTGGPVLRGGGSRRGWRRALSAAPRAASAGRRRAPPARGCALRPRLEDALASRRFDPPLLRQPLPLPQHLDVAGGVAAAAARGAPWRDEA